MSSRMDRYNSLNDNNYDRSTKNKNLYSRIQDLDSYSNIEGVATIENTNEIDISKVKDMIKNRETYKKRRQFDTVMNHEEEKPEIVEKEKEEEKIYDIKDILSKIKKGKEETEANYRKLTDKQFEALKSLTRKENKIEVEKEDKELQDLINTVTSMNAIAGDDVGLLDELKSNTMVGDASSIKKIIDDEKDKKEDFDATGEIDKSFYTSSFGFTSKDFEELKNMNHKIKKSNKTIIILLGITISLIVIAGIYLLLK